MTGATVHPLTVFFALVTIASWAAMMILLEKVTDPRARWVKLASFTPVLSAYERLPDGWGPLHAVLLLAGLLWLGAVLTRNSKLRPWLFVASAGSLAFLTAAWALAPTTPGLT